MDKLGWSDGIASDDALIRFIDRICPTVNNCLLRCPIYDACKSIDWEEVI